MSEGQSPEGRAPEARCSAGTDGRRGRSALGVAPQAPARLAGRGQHASCRWRGGVDRNARRAGRAPRPGRPLGPRRIRAAERPFDPCPARAARPSPLSVAAAASPPVGRPTPSTHGSRRRAAACAGGPARSSRSGRRPIVGSGGRIRRRWWIDGRPSSAPSRPGVSRSADSATSACPDGSCARSIVSTLAGCALRLDRDDRVVLRRAELIARDQDGRASPGRGRRRPERTS